MDRKNNKTCRPLILPIFFAIIMFILDYITKVGVRNNKEFIDGVTVIPSILQLIYVKNSGAAFSLLRGHTELLITLTGVAMVVGLYYAIKYYRNNILMLTGVFLIISGGLGNLIDRVIFGYVTDMISFSFFPPVFNVADIGVTVGAGIVAIYLIFFDKENR